MHDVSEIERAITALARGANGRLIVMLNGLTLRHRALISTTPAGHRLPAVYPARAFATGGGRAGLCRVLRAVNRILSDNQPDRTTINWMSLNLIAP